MSLNLCFLIRKLKRDQPEKLPKDVAVISISETKDSQHYLFNGSDQSLTLHPELSKYVKEAPSRYRHVIVKLSKDQALKYHNPSTQKFHFNGQLLKLWHHTIYALTSNYKIKHKFVQ